MGLSYTSMSTTFVEYVRDTDGMELYDYTRNNYQTVFIRVETDSPEVKRTLVDKAKEAGYSYYHGPKINQETGVEVEVFSKDERDSDDSTPNLYR